MLGFVLCTFYVTDLYAADIVEYSHGGTTPIKTLADGYGAPIGCSVDPTTGNLAVANFEGNGSTCMGGIVIYENASGGGTLYQDKDFNYYWPPGYDAKGNLYVEGKKKETKGRTGLAMIAAGSELVTVPLSGGKIGFPGGMQWDGHFVTATDQAYQGGHLSGIYRVTVASSQAKVVGSTELSDKCSNRTRRTMTSFSRGSTTNSAVSRRRRRKSRVYVPVRFLELHQGRRSEADASVRYLTDARVGQTVSPMKVK